MASNNPNQKGETMAIIESANDAYNAAYLEALEKTSSKKIARIAAEAAEKAYRAALRAVRHYNS